MQKKVSVGSEPFYFVLSLLFSSFIFFFSLFIPKLSVWASKSYGVSMQAEKLAAFSRPSRDSRLEGPAAKRRRRTGGWGWEVLRGRVERGEREFGDRGGGGGSQFQKRLLSFIPKN